MNDYLRSQTMFKVRVTRRPRGKARFWFAAGDVVDAYAPGGIMGATVFLIDLPHGESWDVRPDCWERVAPKA